MRPARLLVFLTLLPVAAAAAPQVLIGGGGQDVSAAQAWLERFEDTQKDAAFGGFVSWAPGFPKVVASNSVPGLKPGLHVVLLGFCAEEETAARLAVLKQLDAGIYARATTALPEAPSCPEVKPDLAARGWTVAAEVRPDQATRLVAWRVPSQRSAVSFIVMHLEVGGVLVDGHRLAEARLDTEPSIDLGCTQRVSALEGGRGVEVSQSCRVQVPGPAAACVRTADETFHFTVGAGRRIGVKRVRRSTGKLECAGE